MCDDGDDDDVRGCCLQGAEDYSVALHIPCTMYLFGFNCIHMCIFAIMQGNAVAANNTEVNPGEKVWQLRPRGNDCRHVRLLGTGKSWQIKPNPPCHAADWLLNQFCMHCMANGLVRHTRLPNKEIGHNATV